MTKSPEVRFIKNASAFVNDLRLVEDINVLFDNNVIVYGAGQYGRKMYASMKLAGIPVLFFCDGDENKWGNEIDGIEIISPDKLAQYDASEKLAIIISAGESVFIDQILNTISSLHLRTEYIFTRTALQISLAQNIFNGRISESFRSMFLNIYDNIGNLQDINVLGYTLWSESKFACQYIDRLFENAGDEILVYTIEKTGSSSVLKSLSLAGIPHTRVHNVYQYCFAKKDNTDVLTTRFQNMLRLQNNIKMITLVREPFSRSLSVFFAVISGFGFNSIVAPGASFIGACADFMEREVAFQFDWFDNELKALIGIDIFEHPFDRENGYGIIKHNNIELLVMKLEKLGSLESVLGKFVGVPCLRMVNDNESNEKPYKYLYDNIKNSVKIQRSLFDAVYKGNARMDHFYSEKEKAIYADNWSNNVVD